MSDKVPLTLKFAISPDLWISGAFLVLGRIPVPVGTLFYTTCEGKEDKKAEIIESYCCLIKRLLQPHLRQLGAETIPELIKSIGSEEVDENTMVSVMRWKDYVKPEEQDDES